MKTKKQKKSINSPISAKAQKQKKFAKAKGKNQKQKKPSHLIQAKKKKIPNKKRSKTLPVSAQDPTPTKKSSHIKIKRMESHTNIRVFPPSLTASERTQLIQEYMPLIRFIAKKICVRLPANIDMEDLVSNGMIGLMDAVDKYDSTRDNKFKTYAEFRIRGAILDGLRAQDWVPRSVRDKAKMLERSYTHLESKLGRPPTERETAKHLGLTTKEFYGLLNQVQPVNVLSIDSVSSFSNMDRKSFFHILQGEHDPFSHLNVKSVKTSIKKMIAELPERQRIVLSLYYYEGFNLRKIGSIIGVTESRVSQLHAQAIQRLKVKLQQEFKEHELKVA